MLLQFVGELGLQLALNVLFNLLLLHDVGEHLSLGLELHLLDQIALHGAVAVALEQDLGDHVRALVVLRLVSHLERLELEVLLILDVVQDVVVASTKQQILSSLAGSQLFEPIVVESLDAKLLLLVALLGIPVHLIPSTHAVPVVIEVLIMGLLEQVVTLLQAKLSSQLMKVILIVAQEEQQDDKQQDENNMIDATGENLNDIVSRILNA